MDIRRFFDRFIDVTDITDEQLMRLWQDEQERKMMREVISRHKQSQLFQERRTGTS